MAGDSLLLFHCWERHTTFYESRKTLWHTASICTATIFALRHENEFNVREHADVAGRL